ncbi:hypothetical protein B7494_g3315 [Chlorociboria aeruginascens]|nr:hypothetical protein B7494_g3315 [Chlorociboria aeruginascens]
MEYGDALCQTYIPQTPPRVTNVGGVNFVFVPKISQQATLSRRKADFAFLVCGAALSIFFYTTNKKSSQHHGIKISTHSRSSEAADNTTILRQLRSVKYCTYTPFNDSLALDMSISLLLDDLSRSIRDGKDGERPWYVLIDSDCYEDLKAFFDKSHKAENIDQLTDASYHAIYECVFKATLSTKQAFLTAKKTTLAKALTRLTSCGETFRVVVKAGTFKLRAKTVEAVIDHIIQTLPNANEEYCEPLAEHYLKALSTILDNPANVERLKIETWEYAVEFCLKGINHYSDETGGDSSGSNYESISRSATNGQTQSQTSFVSRQNVEDLIQSLVLLVSASNAPRAGKAHDIANSMLHFLRLSSPAIGHIHQLAFSVINNVLSCTCADQTSFSQSIARDAIPLIYRFWQGKALAKDEMLNSVRDEMLILLFSVHLHFEHSIKNKKTADLAVQLSDLLDALRADYGKRLDRDQLQLDDLEMLDLSTETISLTPFRLNSFQLRPNIARAERNWAHLQAIGLLEKLVAISENKSTSIENVEELKVDRHPRKRQRLAQSSDRLLKSLKAEDEKERVAGLQILPFLLQDHELSVSMLTEVMSELSNCAIDKRGNIASWALLAMASCMHQKAALSTRSIAWIQSWHTGKRFLTFSATCRAAAVLLHSILARGLVQYHEVGEDVDMMITAADIHGPTVLCEASIQLMIHLLHTRITEVPGASLVACQHVIRWFFARWNPGPSHLTILLTSSQIALLILELLQPKCNDLLHNWRRQVLDSSAQMSIDNFRRAVYPCITVLLLSPNFADTPLPQFRDLEADMQSLTDELIKFVQDSDGKVGQTLIEVLLLSIHPHLPDYSIQGFTQISQTNCHLLRFLIKLAAELKRRRTSEILQPNLDDLMDLDDEFLTKGTHIMIDKQRTIMPRHDLALDMAPASFYLVTGGRLMLIAAMNEMPESVSVGLVPTRFFDQFLNLTDEEIFSCRRFLRDLLHSDLVLDISDANRLVVHIGAILEDRSDDFGRCEIALGVCLDILVGLGPLWSTANSGPLGESAAQLYEYFIEKILKKNIASAGIQKGIAELLLHLLKELPQDGNILAIPSYLPSPRSSLLDLLQKGNVLVQFYIGNQIPDIFELYLLKFHDEVFRDVLDHLPSNDDYIEGIAFRLFVLEKLASRWPTLLRRCIYHIFETPPRVPDSTKHAIRCLANVSSALGLSGSQDLFGLFAPQLLYTWLNSEDIQDIPYQIFGFPTLKDLLVDAKEEAVGLMVMRGQGEAIRRLAALLGTTELKIVQNCFTKAIAYSIGHDFGPGRSTATSKSNRAEAGVKNYLGKDLFLECISLHFPDVVALFFNLIDQEEPVENNFAKSQEVGYAAEIMQEIKSISSSDVELPPNQQPMFKARHLHPQITHLCSRTQYDITDLYTPTLVTFIARKLLDTVHPSLGSLHACSVLRKLRVLISLSGDSGIQGYPLEMLLQSVRPFLTDPECIDDAIGIVQYLLTRGSAYLSHSPSFVAGIALSILGSLRVFLQSSPSHTTQGSQFNATVSKAEKFHGWLGQYIKQYTSPKLNNREREDFLALVESAYNMRSIGNADIGTPESTLLFHLLEDEKTGGRLLNRPSRKLAMEMLCSEFRCPSSFRIDILGSDDLAIENAAVIWESCRGESVGKQYTVWAAKVLGRAFSASGHINQELLRESTLTQIKEVSMPLKADVGSQIHVLSLVRALTLGNDRHTVGLAEATLRVVVSASQGSLSEKCFETLTETLSRASNWAPYQIPPSDLLDLDATATKEHTAHAPFSPSEIHLPNWLREFTIVLARSVPDDAVLQALVPILRGVPGFAEQTFPYVLHLVLSAPSQSRTKKQISAAFGAWFEDSESIEKNNLKMLINSILYLRTQPLSRERSVADRLYWLEIDYSKAASAAVRCGMFKTALLFVEEFCSALPKSRRSSAVKYSSDSVDLPKDILLTIYQNIDDPDLYYGVQQNASLSSILDRLEYEKDGSKSLAFRGALYDSHVRRHDVRSVQDAQYLVKALDELSLTGLSHSLLQAQQGVGMDTASMESMFRTARQLEQWDIPVPSTCNNNPVTLYKAFQAVHTAVDHTTVLKAINEGFEGTMANLLREDLSVGALHSSLQTLAALVEMDEVYSTQGSNQFEGILLRFDDISQILSSRSTTLSILSQQPRLQKILNVEPLDTRLVEVRTALLSSKLNRAHNGLQESLSLATSLIDLIQPCLDLGLNIEAVTHLEAANALWDQGEMTSSIGMLKALDKGPLKVKQSIPVGRSDLLSRIGYQVSIARLEKPDQIIENYLKPALKELKANNNGSEAGQVFHEFAVFCDQQLQDPDSQEDLERLRKLSENKRTEVKTLSGMMKDPVSKERYKKDLGRARQWLALDKQEHERLSASRDEFLRQSLEHYLLALSASDDHDSDALRFSALWLEHSEQQLANEAVSVHLDKVPSRKFATLTNQLTSRLLDNTEKFQQLLFSLVLRVCTDHPYHGMYQIYATANSHLNKKDEVAVSRHGAAMKVSKHLGQVGKAGQIWQSIFATNKAYCQLAVEDNNRYKSGKRIPLKDSLAGNRLNAILSKYPIPPPTMQVELAADLNYSNLPIMIRFESQISIASGVSHPKIVTAVTSSGTRFKQLVKGGNDDLRQDAIMEQVFAQVSELLKANRSTRQRNLSIRTYKVLPLTSSAGLIEFVANTVPLHDFLMPAHQRYYPNDIPGDLCRQEIGNVQTHSLDERIKKFHTVTERFHPVMRHFFTEKFDDPDEWLMKRLAYTRSTAAISILGHVLGLGDRHGHNILLDSVSGEVVHIDLGVAFEMGRVLQVPELVPFRLTRDIVDGMGITKTEGVFRRCCEFTLEALRKEVYSIMTILDVLRYDPLYSWSISPVRLAKLRDAQSAAPETPANLNDTAINGRTKEMVNEPGEAERALTVVNKKLSKTLSVSATVNDLINQASDMRNLAVGLHMHKMLGQILALYSELALAYTAIFIRLSQGL